MSGFILGILPEIPHIPLPIWMDTVQGYGILGLFAVAFVSIGFLMAYGLKYLWGEPAGEG